MNAKRGTIILTLVIRLSFISIVTVLAQEPEQVPPEAVVDPRVRMGPAPSCPRGTQAEALFFSRLYGGCMVVLKMYVPAAQAEALAAIRKAERRKVRADLL